MNRRNVTLTRMRKLVVPAVLLVLLTASCTGGSDGSSTTTTPTSPGAPTSTLPPNRPSSPAKIEILSPKNGDVVHGTSLRLKLALQNAKVVPANTTHIVPNQGHVHVLVDSQVVTMTFGLQQTIRGLTPGSHLLEVEFVASDHAPFNPRVLAQPVTFEVKA
jgi:hypothetical protein